MRDYLFRGKQLGGEWIYGDLLQRQYSTKIGCYVITPPTWQDPCGDTIYFEHEVIGDTVGQFTGLKDKNGKVIYEGDILLRTQRIDGNWIDRKIERFEVAYNSSIAGFEFKPIDGKEYKQYTVRPFGGEELEIVGNIHDVNPAGGQSSVNYMQQDPNEKAKAAEANEQATEQESAGQAAEAPAAAGEAAQDAGKETEE